MFKFIIAAAFALLTFGVTASTALFMWEGQAFDTTGMRLDAYQTSRDQLTSPPDLAQEMAVQEALTQYSIAVEVAKGFGEEEGCEMPVMPAEAKKYGTYKNKDSAKVQQYSHIYWQILVNEYANQILNAAAVCEAAGGKNDD